MVRPGSKSKSSGHLRGEPGSPRIRIQAQESFTFRRSVLEKDALYFYLLFFFITGDLAEMQTTMQPPTLREHPQTAAHVRAPPRPPGPSPASAADRLRSLRKDESRSPPGWWHTPTTRRVEDVCAHTAPAQAGAARIPERRHGPRSRRGHPGRPQRLPLRCRDPPPPPRARRGAGGAGGAALPAREGSASPGALLHQNINFPEIRRHYATAAGGGSASRPGRRAGAGALQSKQPP